MSGVDDREAVFRELFGEPAAAYDDPELPGVQVRRFFGPVAKGHPRYDVWVTVGMSDRPMQNPDGDNVRRELISTPSRVATRRRHAVPGPTSHRRERVHRPVAHHQGRRDLFAGGDVDAELPHVVLLSPLLRHHAALGESLEIDGDSVEFLWPVPISAANTRWSRRRTASTPSWTSSPTTNTLDLRPGRKSYVNSGSRDPSDLAR